MYTTQKRRILAALLAFVLLTSAGCAGNTTKEPDTGAESGTTATTETVDSTETDPYADVDFGGQSLRFCSSNDTFDATNAHRLIAGSGELNGEMVNDAVYNRNAYVQELLNIKLDFTPVEWAYNISRDELNKLILAGEDLYDVLINDMSTFATYTPQGYFHSLSGNRNLSMDSSYWYASAMDELEIVPGARYMMLGDYFTDCLASAHVLYYNKTVIEDVTGDANKVQELVMNGSWTVDEMTALVEETAIDLDGDGAMGKGDRYGYTVMGPYGPLVPVVMGFDLTWIEKHSDGSASLAINNERSVTALEKMISLYWNNGTLQDVRQYYSGDNLSQLLCQVLANGESVFVGYLRLCDLEQMRDVEYTIGLAPYPKLEGTQEQYVSTIHDTTEVGVIPMTMPLSNMDFVTTCLEVLGRETAKTVLPAYYDNGLKVKYVDGSDEAAMIDLIHDTVASPFILGYGLNGLMSDMFLSATSSKQSDFSSQYAKNEAKYQTALHELITQLTESVDRANG